MSQFIDLVVPDIANLPGLSENRILWAGQWEAFDPPRYQFESLHLTLNPIPGRTKLAVEKVLPGVDSVLSLSEELVLVWRRKALSQQDELSLRALFAVISSQAKIWAVMHDSDSMPIRHVEGTALEVFDELARVMADGHSSDQNTVLWVRT